MLITRQLLSKSGNAKQRERRKRTIHTGGMHTLWELSVHQLLLVGANCLGFLVVNHKNFKRPRNVNNKVGLRMNLHCFS